MRRITASNRGGKLVLTLVFRARRGASAPLSRVVVLSGGLLVEAILREIYLAIGLLILVVEQ
jgi:hypothetical protein